MNLADMGGGCRYDVRRTGSDYLGGAGFGDDGDPDLAGVGEFLLDLLGDVTRHHLRGVVVDGVAASSSGRVKRTDLQGCC